jgi:outer membrane protein TolC
LSLFILAGGCVRYEPKPLAPAAVEQALNVPPSGVLRVAAKEIRHPILKPVELEPGKAMTPEQAAVLAVIVNPDLRAARDQRAVAGAQVIQAGLLPNPQLSASVEFPYSSSPPDNHIAYNFGPTWEITSLIAHDARKRAAAADAASVDLDIAWKEWQTAQAAKLAAYDALALEEQLAAAREADKHLAENLQAVRRAVERHQKTLTDLAAAESAYRDAHTATLNLERDLARQRLALRRAIGLPPEAKIELRMDSSLPSKLQPPGGKEFEDIEVRRLDLLALKKGYESQDEKLRVAILGQFPKISLGPILARDTTNVHTAGLGAGIDLPVFDRNQGAIAVEQATRQKLFDEYAARLFAARADIATALEDIESTNRLVAEAQAGVASLEELVRTSAQALGRGNVDVLSYYAARTSLDQKRIESLKLRQQLVENWIALEIAAGRQMPLEEKGKHR